MQQTMVEGVRVAWARPAPDDRRETASTLIRALVAELAPGSDLRIEHRCPVCGGAHGRPVLPSAPVHASVAYADPWVVVAVAPDREVDALGIDAEVPDTTLDLTALFAPAHAPDLAGWTAIEAVLKADGRGLLVPPNQVLFAPDGVASVPGGGAFRILPVPAGPDLVVSLALRRRRSAPTPTRRP
ncbi:4-phosphopantetheinyl transferase [Microbacterium sp.]|uniref:4'-phosphopantetheinyl transferase family protein n=1 Tax=Microbacterium sp. TaxID=51671 RepID=UPI001ACAA3AC|nr:4-phosphopantetheinyl transferase [Microbacterium sp.]MBN9156634.1 4-phosphopantetheinyl transferase [Microbacterium sp.]